VNSFSTETQKIAIDLARDAIKLAFIPLFEKLKELEAIDADEEVSKQIVLVKIRLDTLWKVQENLLSPIHEEYTTLGQSPLNIRPGDISNNIDIRNGKFVASLLQGL